MLFTGAFLWPLGLCAEMIRHPSISRDHSIKGLKRLRLGKLNLIPTFLFKGSMDTNALYSDTGKQRDAFFDIQPGLDMVGKGARLDVLAGYKFLVHKNARFSQQDYTGHDFRGELFSTPFTKRIYLQLIEDFRDTSEPADVEILNNTRVITNILNVSSGYITPGENLEISMGYVNTYKKWDEIFNGSDFFGNSVQLRSKVNLSSKYRFLPKTQATFEFDYTRANQTYNNSFLGGDITSNAYRTMFGLVGAFTRRLSIIAKLGFNRINFSIGESASDLVAEAGINYFLMRRFRINTAYSRKIDYSIYSPYSSINGFKFSVSYDFLRKWSVDLKFDLDDINFSGPVDNGAGEQRDDLVLRLRLEGAYRFKKWLSFILGYGIENRDSNLVGVVQGASSAEFLRHTVYFGLGFNYF